MRRIWSQHGARAGLQEAHGERAPGVARLFWGKGLDSRGSGVRESGDVSDDGEMTDVTGGAEERILAHQAEIGVSPGLGSGRMWSGRDRSVEEGSCESETAGLHSVGKEAKVADPDESLGHDMTQPASHEFRGGESHGLTAASVLSVLVVKGHAAVVVSDDALVADGDAMRVAAEIAQDLLGAGHGRLGVDDEFLGRGTTQKEACCVLGQVEPIRAESVIESFEELPSKDF